MSATSFPRVSGVSSEESLTTAKRLGGGRMVMLGDSITHVYNHTLSTTEAGWEASGAMAWANALLGNPFDITIVHSSGGGLTQDITARVTDDIHAINPNWVYVHPGANTIKAGWATATADSMIAEARNLLNKIMQGGYNIIVMNLWPQGDGIASLNATELSALTAYNAWLLGFCNTNGLIHIDGWSVLVDDSSNDYMRATSTSDGIHPSGEGGYLAGLAIYNALKNRTDLVALKQSVFPDDNAGNPGEVGGIHEIISKNPENAGTGGNGDASVEAGSVIPANWRVARTAGSDTADVSVVVADAGDPDQTPWLQLVTLGGGTAHDLNIFQIHNWDLALSKDGEFFEGAVEIISDVDAITDNAQGDADTDCHPNFEITFSGGGNTISNGLDTRASGWSAITKTSHSMLLKTLPVLVPTGTGSMVVSIWFRSNSSISSAIKIRNCRVYKVNPRQSLILPGTKVVAMTDANYTLALEEERHEILEMTGTLTAGRSVFLHEILQRQITVVNSTAQILTFKTTDGTGTAVAAGTTAVIRNKGTDVVRVTADV